MNSTKIFFILKIINSQKEKRQMFSDYGRIWDLGLCDLSHKVSKSRALFSPILENLVIIPAKMLGHCIDYGTPMMLRLLCAQSLSGCQVLGLVFGFKVNLTGMIPASGASGLEITQTSVRRCNKGYVSILKLPIRH